MSNPVQNPPVQWTLELFATNKGYPMSKVVATFSSNDIPEGHYIPRIEVNAPVRLLGQSVDQLQREAIAAAQACIQEDALRDLIVPL